MSFFYYYGQVFLHYGDYECVMMCKAVREKPNANLLIVGCM